MRDDRTVIVAVLNRLDASVMSLSAEIRALRSQFDRFRNEVRERLPQNRGGDVKIRMPSRKIVRPFPIQDPEQARS